MWASLRVLSAVFACSYAYAPAALAQVPLRVKGTATIEANVTAIDAALEVRGLLKDDAGRSIGHAHVQVRMRDAVGGAPLRLPPAEACAPTPLVHEGRGFANEPDEYVLDTDGSGAFCVRFEHTDAKGVVELTFQDSGGLYDRTTQIVPVDRSRRTLELSFSPAQSTLYLDQRSHLVKIDTRVRPEPAANEARSRIQVDLRFELPGGPQRELSSAQVFAGESAELKFTTEQLGGPGQGRLIARFAGSDTIQPAETSSVTMKTAVTKLALAGKLGPSDPREGVALRVAVGSNWGAVPSGSVEARAFNESVGVGRVIAGAAEVTVRFDAPHAGQVPLELRYLPDAPWWLPGEPLQAKLPIAPPSPWRRLPWIVAALGVALWVMSGWRRPARTERRAELEPSQRVPRAAVNVVEAGPEAAGFRGRVLDAHDGVAITNARLELRVPAFASSGHLAHATTDENGDFTLHAPADARQRGAILEVTAAWHSRLSVALPPAGSLMITLVLRRRALLARLVEWTTTQGPPWNSGREPTPGHVARIAADFRAPEVAAWARAVDEAAYGPEPISEAAEQGVRDREPAPSPSDAKRS